MIISSESLTLPKYLVKDIILSLFKSLCYVTPLCRLSCHCAAYYRSDSEASAGLLMGPKILQHYSVLIFPTFPGCFSDTTNSHPKQLGSRHTAT